MISRRKLLMGLLAAPAVVGAASLMPISARKLWPWYGKDMGFSDHTTFTWWQYNAELGKWTQFQRVWADESERLLPTDDEPKVWGHKNGKWEHMDLSGDYRGMDFDKIWLEESAELPPMEDCSALADRILNRRELDDLAKRTPNPMDLCKSTIDRMKQLKVGPYAETDFADLIFGDFPGKTL